MKVKLLKKFRKRFCISKSELGLIILLDKKNKEVIGCQPYSGPLFANLSEAVIGGCRIILHDEEKFLESGQYIETRMKRQKLKEFKKYTCK